MSKWSAAHQALFEQLEEIDPITLEGQRRAVRKAAEGERLAALAWVRQAVAEMDSDRRNRAARLAGRQAAQKRVEQADPTGLGRLWQNAMRR